MQTVVMIRSGTPGTVWMNGRLVGETDAEHAVTLPVSPFGAIYVEHHPYEAEYLPISLRIPFSQGAPLMNGTDDPRVFAALWPDGVTEVELIPKRVPAGVAPRCIGQTDRTRVSVGNGCVTCESADGTFTHSLPEDAAEPRLTPLPDCLVLIGALNEADGYVVILSSDGAKLLLSLTGQNPVITGDGALRILHPFNDLIGHAALETWRGNAQGWQCVHSEPMWVSGAPAWPSTPEGVVIAAMEAAQRGDTAEAQSCFSPACPCAEILRRAAAFDGCTPLRAPLLSGETAVGVLKLKKGLLRVLPVTYRASPGGQFGWQLDSVKLPDAFSS